MPFAKANHAAMVYEISRARVHVARVQMWSRNDPICLSHSLPSAGLSVALRAMESIMRRSKKASKSAPPVGETCDSERPAIAYRRVSGPLFNVVIGANLAAASEAARRAGILTKNGQLSSKYR